VTAIADAHVHLFERGFHGVAGGPPAGPDELGLYERLRRLHGIDRALVVGYEGEPRYAGNNDHVLELARTRAWIAPVAFVPPAPAPTPELLRSYRGRGGVGIALYAADEAEGRAIAGWPSAVFAELRAARAVISLNARPAATATLTPAVDALEGCTLLFSHLGLPGRPTDGGGLEDARARLGPLLALADRAWVWVKLSAPYAISDPGHDFPHLAAGPFVDLVLDAYGPGRLTWGSDFSPALDHVSFAQTLDARLLAGCTPAEIAAVMGGNLQHLLAGVAQGG